MGGRITGVGAGAGVTGGGGRVVGGCGGLDGGGGAPGSGAGAGGAGMPGGRVGGGGAGTEGSMGAGAGVGPGGVGAGSAGACVFRSFPNCSPMAHGTGGGGTGKTARVWVYTGNWRLEITRTDSPAFSPTQPASVQTSISSCSPVTSSSPCSLNAIKKAEPRIPTRAVGVVTL